MAAHVQIGFGPEFIAAIQSAPLAIVVISVPWSGPEREARRIFEAASEQLAGRRSNLHIACFRLKVDEDPASHHWLASLGVSEFAIAGAGSLLWLESGKVVSCDITANRLGVDGVVARSLSLWPA
jgi:hypothetical protein